MKKFYIILLTLLFWGLPSWSTTVQAKFHQLFTIERTSSGELSAIETKFKPDFSVRYYIQYLKRELEDYQKDPKLFSEDKGWDDFLSEINEPKNSSWDPRKELKRLLNSKELMEALNNKELDRIGREFDKRLKGLPIKPYVLAKPNDKKYFYQASLYGEIFDWLFDKLKSNVDGLPAYSVVNFIFEKSIAMIQLRKRYYQNTLFYFLEKPENWDTLGLSKSEVAHIKSSIYESHLNGLGDYFKSKKIRLQWDTYGEKRFSKLTKSADKRFKKIKRPIESIERVNFAFIKGFLEGTPMYFNLLNTESLFKKKVSITLNTHNLYSVRKDRIHIFFQQFALQFLPLHGYIKGKITKYLASKYSGQRINEGFLYGSFVHMENMYYAEYLVRQTLNPYIVQDFERIK